MTIRDAISLLRFSIREYSDDTRFTDEALYNVLLLKRNKFMSQRFRKFYNLSEQLNSTYCLSLEKAKSHDCDCVSVGCDVLKTIHQVPPTLEGRNRDLIRVYTLDYKEIYPVSSSEQIDNQLDPIKKGVVTYSFLNRKIILWNTGVDIGAKPWKALLVDGIWEDETEFDGITYCDDQNEDSLSLETCFNLDKALFVIQGDLMDLVIQESLQHLGIPMQIIEDNTNDSNESIKA